MKKNQLFINAEKGICWLVGALFYLCIQFTHLSCLPPSSWPADLAGNWDMTSESKDSRMLAGMLCRKDVWSPRKLVVVSISSCLYSDRF